MAHYTISRLRVFALLLLIPFTAAPAISPAMAAQNGFGDVMTATSYFPVRNLSVFGPDEDTGALVASAAQDTAMPDQAAALNAIIPAAGDAAVKGELYGPFQPGREPQGAIR